LEDEEGEVHTSTLDVELSPLPYNNAVSLGATGLDVHSKTGLSAAVVTGSHRDRNVTKSTHEASTACGIGRLLSLVGSCQVRGNQD
jgi:hypothetical protein